MLIIITGVSGVGKTTIGKLLSENMGWTFYEGDDYHTDVNLAKMRNGTPLTDDDRWPWLKALRTKISEIVLHEKDAVLSCSALKESYRMRLGSGLKDIVFVYLRGDYQLVRNRISARVGHFMSADLLVSQYSDLEEPQNGIIVDAALEPMEIINYLKRALSL
ncbi:MAG: gluconokinase [Chloroflexota bacterium]|nr:MAG: gluconokinase [Chloroflexota bacterium]